jgi:chemotaxis signal transduction protein
VVTDIEAVRALRVLRARVGERSVALPTARVRRVVRGLRIHPLLGSGSAILGLSRFGGDPLVVVDLGSVLTGSSPASRDRRTVVVARVGAEGATELLGLAVDDVLSVSADPDPGDASVDLVTFRVDEDEGETC